jgi:hypothetical protein
LQREIIGKTGKTGSTGPRKMLETKLGGKTRLLLPSK